MCNIYAMVIINLIDISHACLSILCTNIKSLLYQDSPADDILLHLIHRISPTVFSQ